MKKVISISEAIERISWEKGTAELCANAEASFDQSKNQVVVALDSFISPVDITAPDQQLRASWLPAAEVVRVSADSGEAAEIARDIFHNWVKRLRAAAPPPVSI